MMKITKQMFVALILIFTYACVDDVYLSLSEGVQELFCYEESDKFILLENETNDSLVFKVISYINKYDKESYNALNPNQYHQYINVEFESENDYSGYMYSEGHDNEKVNICLFKLNSKIFDGFLCDTLNNYLINNKEYTELYVFAKEIGKNPILYFTKEQGIVYIDSTDSGNTYSLIEFIKNE